MCVHKIMIIGKYKKKKIIIQIIVLHSIEI
jgi:hypothetical protein